MTQRDQGSYKLFRYISIQTSTKRLRKKRKKKFKIQDEAEVQLMHSWNEEAPPKIKSNMLGR